MIGFLSGELGDPPGGWPEPFGAGALAGRKTKPAVTELDMKQGWRTPAGPTLNRLLFAGPTKEFTESRERYGDLAVLPTTNYLYGMEPGEEYGSTWRRASGCCSACSRSAAPTSAASGP